MRHQAMTVLRLSSFTGTDPQSSPSYFVLEGLYIVFPPPHPPTPPIYCFLPPGLASAPEPFCSRGELIDFKKLILLYRIIPEPG